jgi:DNA-binding transcriptional MerR regulator
MPVQYPIRAAAKLTGISLDTLRAWERRYNAVTPARTERGRLYAEADIRRLLLLRSAVESGRAISQVASLSDAQLEELERKAQSFSRKPETPAAPEAVLLELQPLVDSVTSYDYAATNEELGRLALLLRPTELVYRVVLPLMRMAGENWENGVFQIAQEHMLSACVRNLLGGLVRLQKNGRGADSILFTTPSGELHEFGILAAAMLAVAQQFQVAYLGPNLPAREVLLAVEKSEPQAVVLGIMKTNATPAVRDDVHRLASELPVTTELWLGGGGASAVSGGVVRDGLVVLQDLTHFERHLARLKATSSRESGL